jgi:predicted O-methyltransferase YrrM
MSQKIWSEVDAYVSGLFGDEDPALREAAAASEAAGLPAISISPVQGKLLQLLARVVGARAILEIGTLGGYSTIWLARALAPGGRLVSLEAEPKHAEVARANVARAGLDGTVEIRLGKALDLLPRLAAERRGPFDFVFVDADKPSTLDYFDWAVRLSRPGGLIVVDNVVRDGGLVDPGSEDADVLGMRRFTEGLAADRRVSATVLQTVGKKGHDGFAIARVE